VKTFCSKCRRNFATKKGLDNHVAKNTCKHKSAQCICGKWFVNERGVQIHLRRAKSHPEFSPQKLIRVHKKQLAVTKPELRCPYNAIDIYCACKRVFKSEVSLKNHIKKCTFPNIGTQKKQMMLHWQPVDPNRLCKAYRIPSPNLNPRYID